MTPDQTHHTLEQLNSLDARGEAGDARMTEPYHSDQKAMQA